MGPKSWLLSEHLAVCSCLVITTNLSEYHQCATFAEKSKQEKITPTIFSQRTLNSELGIVILRSKISDTVYHKYEWSWGEKKRKIPFN
jgi:hypothetical protein